MTEPVWGPPIPVDGKRPEFVLDDDVIDVLSDNGKTWASDVLKEPLPLDWILWEGAKCLRLRSDHPHYKADTVTQEASQRRDADVERVAREAWWPHHFSRDRTVALPIWIAVRSAL